MYLKELTLHNIRSYVDVTIAFSEGMVMLAGDIGAGKSSLLHAIEFALFGSKPSELPAASLLRSGADEGHVKLSFAIGEQDVVVTRRLKRGKGGIKQESGLLNVDGTEEELSPIELKSRLFSLLGYPTTLVSKGKDVIFRFTVYTPQEEMKRILQEDFETRLDTLRRLFNIGKYKLIAENASIFMRTLREKKREVQGYIHDLPGKKDELIKHEKQLLLIAEQISQQKKPIEELRSQIEGKKLTLELLEKNASKFSQTRQELALLDNELKNTLLKREENKQRLEQIDLYLASAGTIDQPIKEELAQIQNQTIELESSLKTTQQSIDLCREHMSKHAALKNQASDIVAKIEGLESCPFCLQDVEQDHKQSIRDKQSKTILEATTESDKLTLKRSSLERSLKTFEDSRESLRKRQGELEILKVKAQQIQEKHKEKIELTQKQEAIKASIGSINSKKITVSKTLAALKDVDARFKEERKIHDELLIKERQKTLEFTKVSKDHESTMSLIALLQKDISKKEVSQKSLRTLSQKHDWLEGYFAPLMSTMEQHIMAHIHKEFNDLFKNWFSMLIEDENLSVRLDEQFTPIIIQNGYETSIDYLSGGEKTSIALSYRLALNKVINDIISTIRTKDILILDEPTDGFSSEQLDKVRDVLRDLSVRQLIVVSHESKIESFVDSIIRIGKVDHVSSVV